MSRSIDGCFVLTSFRGAFCYDHYVNMLTFLYSPKDSRSTVGYIQSQVKVRGQGSGKKKPKDGVGDRRSERGSDKGIDTH